MLLKRFVIITIVKITGRGRKQTAFTQKEFQIVNTFGLKRKNKEL